MLFSDKRLHCQACQTWIVALASDEERLERNGRPVRRKWCPDCGCLLKKTRRNMQADDSVWLGKVIHVDFRPNCFAFQRRIVPLWDWM